MIGRPGKPARAMALELDIQRESQSPSIPEDSDFVRWAEAALADRDDCELTLRIVDRPESRALNAAYRGKDAPTNVLSFPAEVPAEIGLPLLGDVIICAPLVAAEAAEQGKPEVHHWAHLTIHGVLHLLGYDHEGEEDAQRMEALEIRLLHSLGMPDPYC
jgi:probable rRNA maturation factor